MKQVQRGFTLIELVMVIVILGVLAAVAIPKFVNVKGDAEKASAEGVMGAIASSAAIRYASSQITGQPAYVVADACSGSYLQSGIPTTCTAPVLTGQSCAIACGSGSATATLP